MLIQPRSQLRTGAGAHSLLHSGLASSFAVVAAFALGTVGGYGQRGGIGPTGGEVAGAAVGAGNEVAAAIIIPSEVSKNHHTPKGCILPGATGLELLTGDAKRFELEGETAAIGPCEMVKLHGTRVKRLKHAAGDRAFMVQHESKDYGPCPAPGRVIGAQASIPSAPVHCWRD